MVFERKKSVRPFFSAKFALVFDSTVGCAVIRFAKYVCTSDVSEVNESPLSGACCTYSFRILVYSVRLGNTSVRQI